MQRSDLSSYSNSWYSPGAGIVTRSLWYLIHAAFFNSAYPFGRVRVFWLRAFGAKVGKGVVVKPHVKIKYPWRLKIGNYCWIGEEVWIDNLENVIIGDHVCISQGAMLLTGNHNYTKPTFDLMVNGITLEDGVWIGAQSLVAPGVTCKSHSVLSVKSVAVNDLDAYGIYHGNPAVKVKERIIV
ncbi:MAG: colanic acid biosynthesis acetyltransferase WcaF [Bacteroidia bacterium]|nr:colanic acid biosynthesis acetyltransferase WcaF [Bacteroidia bacterium]